MHMRGLQFLKIRKIMTIFWLRLNCSKIGGLTMWWRASRSLQFLVCIFMTSGGQSVNLKKRYTKNFDPSSLVLKITADLAQLRTHKLRRSTSTTLSRNTRRPTILSIRYLSITTCRWTRACFCRLKWPAIIAGSNTRVKTVYLTNLVTNCWWTFSKRWNTTETLS